MTSFDARFRLIGSTGLPLGVEIDLVGQRMVVTAAGAELANWPLDQIEVLPRADGYLIEAEGEEVIINVEDNSRFARELGFVP